VLGVAALLVASGRAEEKKAKAKAVPYAGLFSFPKNKIELTDQQKEKLEALRKEYTPQLQEIDAKIKKILTPERQKAAEAAVKTAKEAGKKGKELAEARNAALNLSAEEKAQLKELSEPRGKLVKEIVGKKQALLTDEQKAALAPKKKENKDK
jgi:hypothetical protein